RPVPGSTPTRSPERSLCGFLYFSPLVGGQGVVVVGQGGKIEMLHVSGKPIELVWRGRTVTPQQRVCPLLPRDLQPVRVQIALVELVLAGKWGVGYPQGIADRFEAALQVAGTYSVDSIPFLGDALRFQMDVVLRPHVEHRR